jgi:hypothetical protein
VADCLPVLANRLHGRGGSKVRSEPKPNLDWTPRSGSGSACAQTERHVQVWRSEGSRRVRTPNPKINLRDLIASRYR